MRKGVWERYGMSFRCSECAHMPEFYDISREHVCPNCGAKMIAYETYNIVKKCYELSKMEESI